MARDIALPSLDGEQNELLLEALPIIVWTTLPDGMTNYANAAWLGYTGLSREQTLAGALRSVVHQDDLLLMDDRWQRARAVETAFEIEYRLLRGDGVYRWHLARVVPLRGRDEQITGWLGSATDIHDRKQLEEERAEFLALITHDLKNPLTSILGTAELLRRRAARIAELADRDRLDEGLSAIFQAAQRMTAQIEALVDLASTQSGSSLELHTEPTDLPELLGQLLDEHRLASERHTFRLALADTPLVGMWDSKRIERAIANVLTNAVKYSPMGGQVDVSARRVHLEGADWAEVAVTDRGIGIPARDLPHVFERFYRAHNVAGLIAGTGLGLSGVRQIVEHHGGNVIAASLEGQGTTITIRLPLAG